MRMDPIEPKFLWTCHHMMTVGPFRNKKFLCTCHHTMRMDVVEQKVLVYLPSGDEGGPSQTKILVDLSSRDDGVQFLNKKFLCTCHHVMTLDVVEQNILVHLSSPDEGGCTGTKHSCGPVTTWWRWKSWEQKVLVLLSSRDEGECFGRQKENSCEGQLTLW